MDVKRQCSVCSADLSTILQRVGQAGGPRRIYFAGLEHLFCAGMTCASTFKRAPESFADRGLPAVSDASRPPPPSLRALGGSLFRIRSVTGASKDD